ncbi:MAG TPA: hypothetical protein DCQ51_07705 [Planktothrix sp. UBA8407]|jgi:hypothetical protein|nr:hypothetical protein [Planktothrix sp. UBA8402]HAO11044.1 hypothetical protein [Planktothrix sp. UBA8407]HBK22844.1 hypothetical protein [Planktothrix sp. UBA10369]
MATVSKLEYHPIRWLTMVLATLGLWMGGSLILDFVIMPTMYISGMMEQTGFASVGTLIFSVFNRVELVCAAVGLTGLIALAINLPEKFSNRLRTLTGLSLFLLGIAMIYTYILTPQMSALGIDLNLFSGLTTIPDGMNQLHLSYFTLEMIKLSILGIILGWCYRNHSKLDITF